MLEYEIQIKAYIYLYVYIHTSYTTYLHIIIKKYIKTACLYSLQTSESWKVKSTVSITQKRLLLISQCYREHHNVTQCRNTWPIKQNFIFYYWLVGTHILISLEVRKELCGILFSFPPYVTLLKYKSGHEVP